MTTEYEHDIAISFAGEDKDLAEQIKIGLSARGVSVFFAPSSQAQLLGEPLEDVFAQKYGPSSRYVIVLVTENYSSKDWPRYELSIARDEEKERDEAFILPLLLSDKRMVQIPPYKGHLDLRQMEVEEVIDILVEKVQLHRGELTPKDVFEKAFREWKLDTFIPGPDKGGLFWRFLPSETLTNDEVEFLLRCPGRSAETKRLGLPKLAPKTLAIAAKRLVETAINQNFRLSAICVLGVADPLDAEAELWKVYTDQSVSVNDRARAFELFWKCPSEKSHIETKRVLADSSEPWQLRRAAATNLLGSGQDDQTEALLELALLDPRQEVRSRVVDAIMRFGLGKLAPALMAAYEKERSRKGKTSVKNALRLFNDQTDVIEFGKRMAFGPAFFRPPTYIHNWAPETNRNWL